MFIDFLFPSTEISWKPVFLLPEWHIILSWTNHGRYSQFTDKMYIYLSRRPALFQCLFDEDKEGCGSCFIFSRVETIGASAPQTLKLYSVRWRRSIEAMLGDNNCSSVVFILQVRNLPGIIGTCDTSIQAWW
jgi:hypothetical protein